MSGGSGRGASPAPVLVHPGFHKTGTSSLQRGLEANAARLAPRLRVLLADDLGEAPMIARRYSVAPKPRRLAAFAAAFGKLAETLDPDDPRPLLISAEALAGQIPGRRGIEAYDAAPALVEAMALALRARLGADAPLTFWFTTRAPEAWLRSVYWQNLRTTRVTEDFATYARLLARAADLEAVVARVRARLDGRAEIAAQPLERCADAPLGPLGAALARPGVASDGLAPLIAYNIQPPDAVDRFLALNRSELDDATLSATKRELLRAYRKGGLTWRAPDGAEGPG